MGRTFRHQIFIIKELLEKTQGNITKFHLFIDFKAAYDSMNTSLLYEALYEFGTTNKLVNLIKARILNVRNVIPIGNSISNLFIFKKQHTTRG